MEELKAFLHGKSKELHSSADLLFFFPFFWSYPVHFLLGVLSYAIVSLDFMDDSFGKISNFSLFIFSSSGIVSHYLNCPCQKCYIYLIKSSQLVRCFGWHGLMKGDVYTLHLCWKKFLIDKFIFIYYFLMLS